MKALIAGALFLYCCPTPLAAESFSQLMHHFDYDRQAPLDVRESGVQDSGEIKIHDISFASPQGGRVPAYLVVPPGHGRFAGILFGHWAKDGSPVRNRKEFLDEAVALAHAGAVSLLIDAPFARPEFHPDPVPLSSQEPLAEQQQVIDLRRGIDLLMSRDDVDPARIAYVGHSFDAAVGGILTGVEHRIRAYVLMAGTFAVADYVHSDAPGMIAFRRQAGENRVDEYLATWDWLDPVHYVGHAGLAPVFLQFAETDAFVPAAQRKRGILAFSQPQLVKIYADTDHALNTQARIDRYEWLRKRIRLRHIDLGLLRAVPQTE